MDIEDVQRMLDDEGVEDPLAWALYSAPDPCPYTLSALRSYVDHRGQRHYY